MERQINLGRAREERIAGAAASAHDQRRRPDQPARQANPSAGGGGAHPEELSGRTLSGEDGRPAAPQAREEWDAGAPAALGRWDDETGLYDEAQHPRYGTHVSVPQCQGEDRPTRLEPRTREEQAPAQ